MADQFRLQAIKLLRNSMEKEFYPDKGVKYTDFLATTLSMITIDVMSGETDTCGIHLDGALRLINHGQTWKQQYSAKAETLHRMYFYLRAIFESTLPRHSRSRNLRISCSAGSGVESQDVFCHHIAAECSASSTQITEDQYRDPKVGSYESIYGVPYSLLFLLTKVIDLIQKFYDESFDGRIPVHLIDECDELEHSIMDWPASTSFPSEPPTNYSSSAKIVYYHTAAFHEALIIYFAQHIRLVGHRFLQPHIGVVLDRMEVIEQIKVETNLVAAPLYWPAFIASSEAFDKALQSRFRKWYEHVMFYGIEALRTGFSVLEEVWEMGPQRADRDLGPWGSAMNGTNETAAEERDVGIVPGGQQVEQRS
uniref:Transcription factor domain-containing protein n=1 Tax=Bionectria ochroleuca TaxID=29856 RepID=A0A0B7JR09_BIOOC